MSRSVAGADGCKGGWLVLTAELETHEIRSQILPKLEPFLLSTERPEVLAIDIPIGVMELGPRQCDVIARTRLGPRASTVFPSPIKPLLELSDYRTANALSKEIQDKGISKQAHAIFGRALELQSLLTQHPDLQSRVFEVHPELCFLDWNGCKNLPSKHKLEGLLERAGLVDKFFEGGQRERISAMHRRSAVDEDDVLDAFAALRTAIRIHRGAAQRIPAFDEFSADGIRMAMWY